jgi:hypothetical protein
MVGLVPAIHVFASTCGLKSATESTRMANTDAAMTAASVDAEQR